MSIDISLNPNRSTTGQNRCEHTGLFTSEGPQRAPAQN